MFTVKKPVTNRPANRMLLLLALLLSLALVGASVSPAYGAAKSSASKIKLSKTKASLTVGKTLTLKVKGTKAKVSWSSTNKKIATVTKSGKIKAIKAGKATIKATFKVKKTKKTLKCVVTVKALPPKPVPEPAKAEFSKATVTLADYQVNYVTVSLPEGSTGYDFTVNGGAAAATPVFADGTLLKIAVPAGASEAKVVAKSGGKDAGSATITFASAGSAEPNIFYGTVPMKFSEYFHDVTADGALSTATAFPKDGAVATPKLFISQGTRSGNEVGGVDTVTYAEAEDAGLPYVDAVSTATYGDSVHFAPDGNLTLTGNRQVNNDPNKAITGIAAAEVGVPFDLYANANILNALGKATSQSENVLSKVNGDFSLLNVVESDGKVTGDGGAVVASADVYKPKLMLTDGNWGARTLVNAGAVDKLPGLGNGGGTEGVDYGGTWGDKVTGFLFGTSADLTPAYAGANYWDNFANYIYGGVITDSTGHSEPLVFLQNLFTHRMHEDFDVAISPSRFSRLSTLKSPDDYKVTVFVAGYEDIEFSFPVKNYLNPSAYAESASVTGTNPAAAMAIDIKGLDKAKIFASNAKLFKGTTEVTSGYTVKAFGNVQAKLTLNASFFTGSYQGSYTIKSEDDRNVSKPLTFTVIYPAGVYLSKSNGGTAEAAGYSASSPLSVAKSGDKLYFVSTGGAIGADVTAVSDFAKTIVTSGRSGLSTIEIVGGGTAPAIANVLKRTGAANTPYYIDPGALTVGKTYKLTLKAAGFNDQVFYISVT